MFLRYIVSFVYRCCKSRLRYCTCCNSQATSRCSAIHVCFKCMFQMFHLFQTNVASVLFGCCKNRSRCCICMYVASICFKCFKVFRTYFRKCFIWMLHIFVIIFKCFSSVFRKCFRRLFKCFICLFLCCNCCI
jgi:hypothetical protein